MDVRLRLAKNLKELRLEQSLSQEQFATVIDIHRTYANDLGRRLIAAIRRRGEKSLMAARQLSARLSYRVSKPVACLSKGLIYEIV